MEPESSQEFSGGEEPTSLLGRLEKKLYSRTQKPEKKPRTLLHPKKFSIKSEWEGNETLEYKKPPPKVVHSAYTKLFLFSVLFFVVAAFVAGYNFYNQRNIVSPDNVKLSVFGPVSVKSGDTLIIQVMIENKNSVSLSNVVVGADFPNGSRYPNNPDKTFPRYRKTIGKIEPGETRTEMISAVLFGSDSEEKEINVYSEFAITGSSAVYTTSKKFLLSISKSPLTIRADVLKETIAGQAMTFDLDVESGSESLLANALVKIDYPVGFIFTGAVPAPSSGNNIWSFANMKLGDVKHIAIRGKMDGENGQEKVFRIYTGTASKPGSMNIETKFGTLLSETTITKPFLGIKLLVDGTPDPNYVAYVSKAMVVSVNWTNMLPDKIIDAEINMAINGEAINKNRVRPQAGGFYDDMKNTIFWDERTTEELKVIPAGGIGAVGMMLEFVPFARPDKTTVKNPMIDFGISIKGSRVSESGVPESIDSFIRRQIRVNTVVDFTAIPYYYSGPIENTGPIPPVVGKETTYTINWKVTNTSNGISGAKVSALLPPYVRWTGKVFPTGARISYNPISAEITWNIEEILAGAGFESEAPEVSFQIGLTPGLAQVKQVPNLISASTFSGRDDFTSVNLKYAIPPLTTTLQLEKNMSIFDGVVVEK